LPALPISAIASVVMITRSNGAPPAMFFTSTDDVP